MSNAAENITVPGQGVLPGLEEAMRCESSALPSYREEMFCWEYFWNDCDPTKAYRLIWRPTKRKKKLSDNTARRVARRWMLKSHIKSRIEQISTVFGFRLGRKVISDYARILEMDSRKFFHDDGSIVKPHEMDEATGKLIHIEARYVDGATRYLPVFPDKQKVREQVAKISGIQVEKVEMTGKDGGAVEHKHDLSDEMLTRIALGE